MKLRPKGAESSKPRAQPWVVCVVVFRPEGALRCQPRDVRLCRLSTNGAQETPWVVCVWRGSFILINTCSLSVEYLAVGSDDVELAVMEYLACVIGRINKDFLYANRIFNRNYLNYR